MKGRIVIIFSIFLVAVGLLFLIKSADYLVEGASSVALRFKVAPIVIGLTVVAFGTSAPELVVSLLSAIQGNTDIALSNVTGSNIANILLILGLSAVIYPVIVHKNTVWKEIPMSFLAAIVLAVLGLQSWLDSHARSSFSLMTTDVVGSLTFSNGLILLSFFIVFLYYTFGLAKVTGDNDMTVTMRSFKVSLLYIIGGLAGLGLGSKLVVDNAVLLARGLGVSDMLIGLTIVAVGTSLPELVTSITASLKKNNDIVIGNIIGSNIFNIFFILGITSLVRPLPMTGQGVTDILILLAVTVFLFISLFIWGKHMITKREGFIMLASYVAYISFVVLREI